MTGDIDYTNAERIGLLTLAIVGFTAVNGAFLYGLLVDRSALDAALANPVSMAFIAEALLMVAVFAYLLRKWKVARLGWGWFVALSLIGSLAFALPIVLLWPRRRRHV